MLTPILTTVGIAAVTAWLGFLAVRYLLPNMPNPATTIRAARQAARNRVTRDPLDYVRVWVARVAPSRLKVEQRTVAAQTTVEQSTARETHILTAFKDGKEPKLGFKVFAIAMFVAWLFVVLPAVIIIDFPIVKAVSGDNVLAAVFGSLLLIAGPVISSLVLGFFFEKWRSGAIKDGLFSGLLIGLVGIFVALVWYLTTLAPLRAEVEYANQIRTVQQQIAMYQEDGDQNAINFAQQNLDELRAEERRSAEWNTALVPIAATAEFATGFFLPIAIPLLLLADAKSSRRKAEGALVTSGTRVTRQRARQYRRLALTFQRLGITQLELQQHFATVAAENNADQTGINAAQNMVAEEILDQARATEDPTPAPPADQTITTEIAPTTEIAVPPPADRTQTRENNRTTTPTGGARQGPAGAPAPVTVLDRDDFDLPDTSFDLN